jgi:hypothetical protein
VRGGSCEQEFAEFFPAPQHVRLHGAERALQCAGRLVMRQPVLAAEHDGGALGGVQGLEGGGEIHFQIAPFVVRRRVRLGGRLGEVFERKLFPPPRDHAVFVAGDAEEPGAEPRVTTKARQLLPSADERLLRQVVGQVRVAARELEEEAAHRGLVAADQFAEGVLVGFKQRARDKVGIGEGHG